MISPQVVYEDGDIVVTKTGRDYDFIGVIENQNDYAIRVIVGDECDEEYFDIDGNEWIGILADEDGYYCLEELRKGNFKIKEI